MYYLDEIMDRTFDNFAKMVNANNDSFWTTNTTIEAKPTEEPKQKTKTNKTNIFFIKLNTAKLFKHCRD